MRPRRHLDSYAAYLFDVDGTLVYHDRTYVGEDGGLVPGAGVFVAALERAVSLLASAPDFAR